VHERRAAEPERLVELQPKLRVPRRSVHVSSRHRARQHASAFEAEAARGERRGERRDRGGAHRSERWWLDSDRIHYTWRIAFEPSPSAERRDSDVRVCLGSRLATYTFKTIVGKWQRHWE